MAIKIALIGNSNNNFFSLIRYLRDRGCDADLFLLNNEMSHFHPSADTYSLDFMKYTYRLSFGSLYWFLNEIEELKRNMDNITFLKKYDIIFACGQSLAYLEYFNINIDFFVPYGMDIVHYPFYVESANPNHRKHLDEFCCYQNNAIRKCKAIVSTLDMLGIGGYRNAVDKLGCVQKLVAFETFPYIYQTIYKRDNIVKNFNKTYWQDDFLKIKEQSECIIFHHARHVWYKSEGDLANKGNDLFFKAFAKALKELKMLKPVVVTFEYGSHVDQTKELIKELDIQEHVVWMPLMNRKDIMVGLYYADIATGQFVIGVMGGGVQTEAIVSATPLIHYIDEAKYNLDDLYPFLQAKGVDDISNALGGYVGKKHEYDKIGIEASKWLDHRMEKAVDGIIKLL